MSIKNRPHKNPLLGLRISMTAFIKRNRKDILAVLAIVILTGLFFSPALVDGISFGGFDITLGHLSALGQGLYPSIHSYHDSDAVSQMVAWNALDYKAIHAGQFPLWNNYSGIGMPEFANFESSVLSLPDLISYLFPLKMAFLIAVMVKVILAGTGVYVLCRALSLSEIPSLFAGITYMLSGPFINWLTWPLSDVYCLLGWIAAFIVLIYRFPQRNSYVMGLALAIAWSVYGGFPESNILIALGLLPAVLVFLVVGVKNLKKVNFLAILKVLAGCGMGAMLASPLLLTGLRIISNGHRQTEQGFVGLPMRTTSLFIAQGYYGMPVGNTTAFALSKWNYYETVSYIGIIAIFFGLVAILKLWKKPMVFALLICLMWTLAISFQPHELPSLQEILNHLSILRLTRLSRERTTTVFIIAILSGYGFDALYKKSDNKNAIPIVMAVAAVVSVTAYLVVDSLNAHLVGNLATARFDSLIWPVALGITVIVVGFILIKGNLKGKEPSMVMKIALLALVIGQFAELFTAGVGIPTYSKSFYPATPAELSLEKIVKNQLVGLDTGNPAIMQRSARVGFYPEANIGYGIRLFAIHDPLLPSAYYTSWPGPAAKPNGGPGLFEPDVDSAALARRYGIGYILAIPGVAQPPGTNRVTTLDGETLYRVPRSSQFMLTGANLGKIISATYPSNGTFLIKVVVKKPVRLILHVADEPGWQLSANNRTIPLVPQDKINMSALIPPGHYTLSLTYAPSGLMKGMLLAILAIIIFIIMTLFSPLKKYADRRGKARLPILSETDT
ncbi:MAG: YfhO family protein [Firmicutes bacterium]|nr:YfhO family protein [Bacillota bacterium]